MVSAGIAEIVMRVLELIPPSPFSYKEKGKQRAYGLVEG